MIKRIENRNQKRQTRKLKRAHYYLIGLVFLFSSLTARSVFGITPEDISRWEEKKAIEPLIAALGDKNDGIRESAAEALYKIGNPASESLIAALHDKYFIVRKNAVELLGRIGDLKAFCQLVSILINSNESEEIREKARETLLKIYPNVSNNDLSSDNILKNCVPKIIDLLKNKESAYIALRIIVRIKQPFFEKLITLFKMTIILHQNVLITSCGLLLLLLLFFLLFLPFILSVWGKYIKECLKKRKTNPSLLGIFILIIFSYSCLMSISIFLRFMHDLLVYGSIVDIGIFCFIMPLITYNMPIFIFFSTPIITRKWLRAKQHAKHFICSRCFRWFILGSGLPWIVRWSRRILFVERLKQHDNFEDYFICKTCEKKDRRLVNVRKVIGLIGGDVIDYRQEGDKVYVNLWFEQEKKAQNADIDVLEIKESDGISYDYAVNAVLNVLKNDVSRPRKYVKKIPIIIKGKPPLSENSIMILKHEFGGVKYS